MNHTYCGDHTLTPADPLERVEKLTGRGDPLTALKWCRERRYVWVRYIEARARAMRPVNLPGVHKHD